MLGALRSPPKVADIANGARGAYRICVTVLCGRCAEELVCPPEVDSKKDAKDYAIRAGWGYTKEYGFLCPPTAYIYDKRISSQGEVQKPKKKKRKPKSADA